MHLVVFDSHAQARNEQEAVDRGRRWRPQGHEGQCAPATRSFKVFRRKSYLDQKSNSILRSLLLLAVLFTASGFDDGFVHAANVQFSDATSVSFDDPTINTETVMTISGTLSLTEIPVGATLSLYFSTQNFASNPQSVPDNFRFFSATAALETNEIDGVQYPNPTSLKVKEISSTGDQITLEYTAASTSGMFQIRISGFNTPFYPTSQGNYELSYQDGGNSGSLDTSRRQYRTKAVEFSVRASSLYPTPVASILPPAGQSSGYQNQVGTYANSIKITIPASSLLQDIPYGYPDFGFFKITPPDWIDGFTDSEYKLLATTTECTSDEFELISAQSQWINEGSSSYYKMVYDDKPATADIKTTGFSITCTESRNPMFQKITDEFVLTYSRRVGRGDYVIMTFPSFTLDATSLEKQDLTTDIDTAFNGGLRTIAIQTQTLIRFRFYMPYPVPAGGCYLEVKFPKNYPLSGLITYSAPASDCFSCYPTVLGQQKEGLDEANGQLYLKHQDYIVGDADSNRVIIQGCQKYVEAEVWRSQPDWPLMELSMTNTISPSSAGETEDFTFNLYREFESAPTYQLSNHMLSGSMKLQADRFISGNILNGLFSGKVKFIQTNNVITIQFTVSNQIPAYSSGSSWPRIVLVMPKGLVASGTPKVSNLDGSMRDFTSARETSFEQRFENSVEIVDVKCSEDQWVCYSIKSTTTTAVAAGTTMKFLVIGTQNQISKTTLGNWYAQTQVSIDSSNGPYNNIDQGIFDSGFSSESGSISAAKNMFASSYETYFENTNYRIFIIVQYTVPKGGYVKVILPEQVKIETKPTVNIYRGDETGSKLSIKVTNDPVADKNEIHIQLVEDMARNSNGQGQVYTIEWNGNRNPRSFLPTDLFEVWGYDGVNAGNAMGNLISNGAISNLRMKEAQKFQDLKITPLDKTNGVFNNYKIEFSSKVPTLDGDQLYIKFPDTIRTPMIPECRRPDISIASCVEDVVCGTQTGRIVATFNKVGCSSADPSQDRYIFYIQNVQNAQSFIKSEKFTAYTMTQQFQQVLVLDPAVDVTVTTDIAGEIFDGNFTIRQASTAFSAYTDYTIKIVPTNPIPRLGWIEVEIPSHVGIIEDEHMLQQPMIGVEQGSEEFKYEKKYYDQFIESCKIETTKPFGKENCNLRVLKVDGPIKRFVTIYNTFLYSEFFSSEFTITMKLRNPDDNFPRQDQKKEDKAFKIRTFTFDLLEMSTNDDIKQGSIKSDAKKIYDDAQDNADEWMPYDEAKLNELANEILKIGKDESARNDELNKNIYKQIDKWDLNTKTYKLKCNYPCSDCKDDDADYCLKCWGEVPKASFQNKNYFLQPRQVDTCATECDKKFTVNGQKGLVKFEWNNDLFTVDKKMTYYQCSSCDESCATCAGQANKNALGTGTSEENDRIRCTSCGGDIGYFFEQKWKCQTQCYNGQYQLAAYYGSGAQGECVSCQRPCEQCIKCEKGKDKNCEFPTTIDNSIAIQTDPKTEKHPSAYFCTKCYQDNFYPQHIDDLSDVQGYIINYQGMIKNEPFIDTEKKEKYNFNSNKNILLQIRKEDPKYKATLERFDKNDQGDEFTIEVFLAAKAEICEECGMENPKDRFGVTLNDEMTFRQLYLALYTKFKFPLRSLFENRCISQCPNGFTDIAGYCQPCDGEIANCEWCRNSRTKCTKCRQDTAKKYLLGVSCLEECPLGTVKNDPQGRCIGCIDGCDVCEEVNPKKCITCKQGLLLQPDFSCQGTCPEGYRENFRGTECEVESQNTVIYFPLLIMAGLAGLISIGGKYSSKNLSGQHRRLLSFYAMLGVIDVLAMWLQIIFTFMYGKPFMLAIPGAALLVNYVINYLYKKLWDVIDPPKPNDEDALLPDEIALINKCDENFDKWNTKYYRMAQWTRYIVMFISHKFFLMPFTHFFGYLQFTLRSQDHYVVWSWDDRETIRFQRGFISQKQLQNPNKPFKYKGKLVHKKADNFESDMLSKDPFYRPGTVEVPLEVQDEQAAMAIENQQNPEDSLRNPKDDGQIQMEGGEPEYSEEDSDIQYEEGGFSEKGDVNPFTFIQHYNIYPRKPEEFIEDNRQFEMYKKGIKIDCIGIRPILIIGNIYIIASHLIKQAANQLLIECLECIILSIIMIILQIYFQKNWEAHRLPFKMKDTKSNYLFKKKRLPNEMNKALGKTEEEQLMPDWGRYMHLYKFNEIFLDNKLEEMLNVFGRRLCKSCIEFNTGTEKEEDPRKVKSWPLSPRGEEHYRSMANDFDLIDFQLQNNVYADTAEPTDMFKSVAQLSMIGTQVFEFDVQNALDRKGGDLLTPGIDEGYKRKGAGKKKRGRKNKYYLAIDKEDDEEANQISDDSENDGLDNVKEEDDEDEEDELVKKRKAAEEQKRREEEEKRILAEEEARRKKEEEATRKAKEAQDKSLRDEEEKIAKEQADREKMKKEIEEMDKKKKEALENEIVAKHSPTKGKEKGKGAGTGKGGKGGKDGKGGKGTPKKGQGSDKHGKGDSASESGFSNMQVQQNALGNFQGQRLQDVMEIPPNPNSGKFNECDIIGEFERDDKGNVIALDQNGKGGANIDKSSKFKDNTGKDANQRGYLIDPKTGDVINNLNGETMFKKGELDDRGEVPAPFNVDKHNFNPHRSRGDFDYDKNGKAIIKKNSSGQFVDKRGAIVSQRGYRINEEGHVMDNYGRKKFDSAHMTPDGDLPKLFNYNGRRFDIIDTIGQLDKDANGEIMPMTDKTGKLRDKLGRLINSKGYLIDEFGNVIDKDGRQIFEKKHLKNDEIPKIFPFTKFNIKNVLGDFEMDPLGNPILEKDAKGNLIDRKGQRVNSKGYLIDKDGNIIDKNGKLMFINDILDAEGDIPKVFRTGLLKSDTASSLSRLMSEIERNQPSDFDQEEQEIQNEIAAGIRNKKRGHSGQTSVDSMMEDTPANYNQANQRMGAGEDMDDGEGDEDEYGSQYEQMGMTGFTGNGTGGGINELSKKKRKKKKKRRKKPQEMEDPNLREYMLAGAYGGAAKPKPKRSGIKYTTDLAGGMLDLTTPNMLKAASKANLETSSQFGGGGRASSSKGGRKKKYGQKSEMGSQIGSRVGLKVGAQTSSLLDPQQRQDALQQKALEEIRRKKIAKAKRDQAKGKISKDADFEKMFGKDIDEFLEDSEWDIESIDKMSQFSKGSKNTFRSSQASKLKGLEKVYLQRLEANQKQQSDVQSKGGVSKKDGKKGKKFRDGDRKEASGLMSGDSDMGQIPKQAWKDQK